MQRAPVIFPEILRMSQTPKKSLIETCIDIKPYNSGLFCVSMIAATGIPKFDTGPQKSIRNKSANSVHHCFFSRHVSTKGLVQLQANGRLPLILIETDSNAVELHACGQMTQTRPNPLLSGLSGITWGSFRSERTYG